MKHLTLFFLVFFLFTCFASAQDYLDDDGFGGEMELDMGGEMDSGPEAQVDSAPAQSPFRVSVDHAISFRTGAVKSVVNNRSSLNLEYEASLATGLYAKIDATGTLFWAKDHRSLSTAKDYDYDGLIREAWVQKSFDQINFTIGLQSIVWGEVEGAQATDTLNPTDNSEFLFVDFEDVRIGQASLRANLFSGGLTWEAFVTPKPLYSKNPPANSIYAYATPFAGLRVTEPEKAEPEYGVRMKFNVGAAEMAFLAASLTPNQPLYKLEATGLAQVAQTFRLYGVNFNYPVGQTLFKADLGYKTDQGINDQSFGLVFKDKLDSALGVETTLSQHTFAAVVSLSSIQDWDESLLTKEQTGFYNLSWSKSYLNEDLSLNLGMMGVLTKSDQITSALVDYKTSDHLQFSFSLFSFNISDPESDFYAFKDENRLELKTKYQF